jgi:hypothetical protein
MALITSAATGNFSAGATWTGVVVPTVGDEARASTGHTITIDVNTTCDEVSNAGTGIFTLASGVTLTANITNKSTTTSRNCLQFTAASPASASIVGNIVGGGSGINAVSVALIGSGNLNITGNVTGGTSAQSSAILASAGIANITGNVTGGSGASSHGAHVTSATSTINITGNVTGGSGSAAAQNQSTGNLNITGAVTGGPGAAIVGAQNQAGGTLSIVGISTGGSGGPGANNQGNGTIFLTRAKGNAYGPGNTAGLAAAPGAANVGLGVIEIEQLEYGTFGQSPTTGTGIRLKKANSNVAVFNYADTSGAKTLIDATANAAMPAATDVRSGVSYASGAATGSCAVPAASSVAFGVPVDATTGTALLTGAAVATAVWGAGTRTLTAGAGISASDVWSHASRTLTTSSGPTAVQIRQEMDSNSTKLANLDATVSSRLAPSGTLAVVTTLTNAPIVPTPSQIASQVRTELSVELNRVDQAISTRATPANIPTSDISAIKAKTDALNTDRLNNTATLSQVGNLLAQANS